MLGADSDAKETKVVAEMESKAIENVSFHPTEKRVVFSHGFMKAALDRRGFVKSDENALRKIADVTQTVTSSTHPPNLNSLCH